MKELSDKQLNILEVAETLFAKKGYEKTSVRDIAKEADINIAMISYYFGSKEKLLQQLLIQRTEESRVLLRKLEKDHDLTSWEKIDKIIEFYVEKILSRRRFHTIISRQISLSQDEETIALLLEIKKTSRALIHEILEQGVKEGVFRNVDIPFTIGTVIGTVSQTLLSRPVYSELLGIKEEENEERYFRLIKPRLKKHLKGLMRNHLEIK